MVDNGSCSGKNMKIISHAGGSNLSIRVEQEVNGNLITHTRLYKVSNNTLAQAPPVDEGKTLLLLVEFLLPLRYLISILRLSKSHTARKHVQYI